MSSASNRETAARKEELRIAIGMGASWRRENPPTSQCGCVFWDPLRIFIPKEKWPSFDLSVAQLFYGEKLNFNCNTET